MYVFDELHDLLIALLNRGRCNYVFIFPEYTLLKGHAQSLLVDALLLLYYTSADGCTCKMTQTYNRKNGRLETDSLCNAFPDSVYRFGSIKCTEEASQYFL